MSVEKDGETDPGTSLSCHKATVAQLVYSAKRKGERLCSCQLFKENRKQFILYFYSGTNEHYLTWKNPNAIFLQGLKLVER